MLVKIRTMRPRGGRGGPAVGGWAVVVVVVVVGVGWRDGRVQFKFVHTNLRYAKVHFWSCGAVFTPVVAAWQRGGGGPGERTNHAPLRSTWKVVGQPTGQPSGKSYCYSGMQVTGLCADRRSARRETRCDDVMRCM